MRRPYKTPCRFLGDSDLVSTVRWYEAAPNAKTLDRTSIISSSDWESDRWLPFPVGELGDVPKKFLAGQMPAGTGLGPPCGTVSDFDEGGDYEPDLPPVEYRTNGLPKCCQSPLPVVGGGGGSGRVEVNVGPPVGDSCCEAPRLSLGVTYVLPNPTTPIGQWWTHWDLPAGDYLVTCHNLVFGLDQVSVTFTTGTDCEDYHVIGNTILNGTFPVTVPETGYLCLYVQYYAAYRPLPGNEPTLLVVSA